MSGPRARAARSSAPTWRTAGRWRPRRRRASARRSDRGERTTGSRNVMSERFGAEVTMNRSWIVLVALPACFNPEDHDLVAHSPDEVDSSDEGSSAALDADESVESEASSSGGSADDEPI